MITIERRALYYSLRLSWLKDPALPVQPWQVEDYRSMPLEGLFQRLKLQDLSLDKLSFQALAEQADSPEDLSEHLLEGRQIDSVTLDQVYLLIFELWRRLIPEKPSLTIFCDELDHQISSYDEGSSDPELIEDTLSNLQVILDEHADEGGDPLDLFETICSGCANDLESFIYDFISEQIDSNNLSYATELLDAFSEYVTDVKWFDFLRAQVLFETDPAGAHVIIQHLLTDASKDPDLEFNLELLAYLVAAGDQRDFIKLVKKTTPLLISEEDFRDLLSICVDFYHRLDDDEGEKAIQNILKSRSNVNLDAAFDPKDPDIAELYKAMTFRLNAID